MLKPQDIVLLLKLIANKEHLTWSQNQLAVHLCMSQSEVNAGMKRLNLSGLLQPSFDAQSFSPNLSGIEEFLLHGFKYIFPVRLQEYTRGVATSYAAPIFKNQIVIGDELIPVWPYAEGQVRGLALEPLYSSVPKSVIKYPDPEFYDLLALIDIIRQGRARERNIAVKILQNKLRDNHNASKLNQDLIKS